MEENEEAAKIRAQLDKLKAEKKKIEEQEKAQAAASGTHGARPAKKTPVQTAGGAKPKDSKKPKKPAARVEAKPESKKSGVKTQGVKKPDVKKSETKPESKKSGVKTQGVKKPELKKSETKPESKKSGVKKPEPKKSGVKTQGVKKPDTKKSETKPDSKKSGVKTLVVKKPDPKKSGVKTQGVKKPEAKDVKKKAPPKKTKKQLEEEKEERERTLEEELEKELSDEEIENFQIEKVDMERLTNRVCEMLVAYESAGALQGELWKKLKLNNRNGARLALKLERTGIINREKILEKGRWTYKLILKKTPVSTQSIENAPCLVCPVEQKCSLEGDISPRTCQLIDDWVTIGIRKRQ